MKTLVILAAILVSFSSHSFTHFPSEMLVTTNPGQPPMLIKAPEYRNDQLLYGNEATNCTNLSFGFNVGGTWTINGEEFVSHQLTELHMSGQLEEYTVTDGVHAHTLLVSGDRAQELNSVNMDLDAHPEIHCGELPPQRMSWQKRVNYIYVSLQSKKNPAYWVKIEYYKLGNQISLTTGSLGKRGDWVRPSEYSLVFWAEEPVGRGYVTEFQDL